MAVMALSLVYPAPILVKLLVLRIPGPRGPLSVSTIRPFEVSSRLKVLLDVELNAVHHTSNFADET